MNKYELALVLNPSLDEEAKNAALEQAKGYVERFGGEITNIDDWGKRKLAYEMNKVREGFYYFVQFNAEPTTPQEIESRVRIMESVLRYLVVRVDEQ